MKWFSAIALVALAAGCGDNMAPPVEDYQWHLPDHFPEPVVPVDNPMTEAKVQVGRYLFYDERVSADQTQACATCHRPDLAFAGPELAVGHDGTAIERNVPSLANVGYMTTLTWASPDLVELEQLDISAAVLERLQAEPVYASLRTTDDIRAALACFLRTIVSGGAPFDVYTWGRDHTALSESAERGFEMFWSEELTCFSCHDGFNLSRATRYAGLQGATAAFDNTGLYNVDGAGAYPAADPGLAAYTGQPEDSGAFRPPSLRNIAITAPYYHDGSAATLDEVLDDYAAGGRVIAAGPDAGDGRANPHKSRLIHGFELSQSARVDLKAFFDSLTDPGLAADERLSNPWVE